MRKSIARLLASLGPAVVVPTLAFPAAASEEGAARFLKVKEWEGEYSLTITGENSAAGQEPGMRYSGKVSVNSSENFRFKLKTKEDLLEGAVWRGDSEGSWSTQNVRSWSKRFSGEHITVLSDEESLQVSGGEAVTLGDAATLEIDAKDGTYTFTVVGEVRTNAGKYKRKTVHKNDPPMDVNTPQDASQFVGGIVASDAPWTDAYQSFLGWIEVDPGYLERQQRQGLQGLPMLPPGFGAGADLSRGPKLPRRGMVISGSKTIPAHVPLPIEGGPALPKKPATFVIRWNIRPAGLERPKVKLHALDGKWLPEKDGTIEARVTWEGDTPSELQFTLFAISREKGTALMPADPDESADLEFDESATAAGYRISKVSETEWKAVTQDPVVSGGKIRIKALDYGAFGKLKAKALVNGSWVDAEIVGTTTSGFVSVPMDENQNKIADEWEKRDEAAGKAAEWDEETLAGTDNKGDGLTLYEEYRGIFIKPGKHQRLSSKVQEVVVQNEIGDAARRGIEHFTRATGVKAVAVDAGQLGPDRVVNVNGGTARRGLQHGLRLTRTAETGAEEASVDLGEALPAEILDKRSPKECERIVISGLLVNQPGHERWQGKGREMLDHTIAHEIGHAVSIQHHGDGEPQIVDRDITASRANYFVWDADGRPSTKRPFRAEGQIGLPGGKSSGDVGCIMAYPRYYSWVLRRQPGGIHYYNVPAMEFGNHLCSSKQGTGINAGGKYFGDATRGNCRAQVRVKDW